MFFIDPSSHDIGRSSSSAPAAFTPSVRRGVAIDADHDDVDTAALSRTGQFIRAFVVGGARHAQDGVKVDTAAHGPSPALGRATPSASK